MQKGPWKIDQWGNIIDANEHLVILTGIKNPTFGSVQEVTIARANKDLVMQAPSLNEVVGQVIDVLDNPYTSDGQRVEELYNIIDEMRQAHVGVHDEES